MVKISSDVKDYCNNYYIWFDLEKADGSVVRILFNFQTITEKNIIQAEEICDVKGYVVTEKVNEKFEKLLKEALVKKYE